MQNVENCYRNLLLDYKEASKVFLETGKSELLSHSLERLYSFESSFIECWGVTKLAELQRELGVEYQLVG